MACTYDRKTRLQCTCAEAYRPRFRPRCPGDCDKKVSRCDGRISAWRPVEKRRKLVAAEVTRRIFKPNSRLFSAYSQNMCTSLQIRGATFWCSLENTAP